MGRPALAPIGVRTYGSTGPLVHVLHGGPGAPGSAGGLARALGARFRVREPLQRRSGAAPLTVARHVADLAAVLPPRALLVGWSWGAMLALSFASRHPDRVAAIALVACGTYGEAARADYRAALAARLGERGRRRWAELEAELAAVGEGALRDAKLEELGHLASAAQSVDVEPEAGPGLPVDARGHAETWADVLRLQASGEEPAAFAAIRCPVRCFHGDEDPHPGPRIRDDLRRFIPQLGYVGFRGCGHIPWCERAARAPFLAALGDWLEAEAPASVEG